MKHTVETTSDGIRIDASVRGDQQQQLLEEFAKCAAGSCSCPTPQYEKVQSMDFQPQPGGVIVNLQVKPGEAIDVADIEQCLEHTARLVGD